MTLDKYQEMVKTTAKYPCVGQNYVYPCLGLAGESGEVAEKLKKIIRDDNGRISEDKRTEIIKELGDVMWYIAAMAAELGTDINEVAERNYAKLMDRLERNKLQGSGDNR